MTDKILKALAENPRGDMSLEELGDATGLSRGTVSKYVGQLEQAGKVEIQPRGTMKLVSLPKTSQERKGRGAS